MICFFFFFFFFRSFWDNGDLSGLFFFFFLLDMFSFLLAVAGQLPFAQDGIVRGFSFIFMPSLVFYCFGNVFHQQYLSNTHDENPVVYLPAYLSVHSYIHYTQIKSKDHSYHLHDPQNSHSSCRLFSYNPPSPPLRCYCLLLLQLPVLPPRSTEALYTLWGKKRE